MARGRMKHKEVIETLHHSDWDIAKENFSSFWNESIKPYETTIMTVLIGLVVLGSGYMWYANRQSAALEDANKYLADAKRQYDSGDMAAALSDLEYILEDGKYADSRVAVAAEMVNANIAYASGDYEQAISILSRLIDKAPESLKTDLLYQYASAQESSGDYKGAMDSLEKIKASLGEEPDTSNPSREPSVWDRYYYRHGRLLAQMGRKDEAIAEFLKITERSSWSLSAKSEIDWIKSEPVGAIPLPWEPKSS